MAFRKRLKQKYRNETKAFATKRKVDNQKFYNSSKWRKLRKAYVAENPLCVVCESRGFVSAVQEVDHIVPIRLGGSPFDWDNLQSLCKSCHSRKSAKEGYEAKKHEGDSSSNATKNQSD